MVRLLLLALAALTLGACNMVYSEKPLFTAAEAKAGPGLKPGIWIKRAPDCDVDLSRPVKEWPECAEPGRVGPRDIGDMKDASKRSNYILVPGEPHVMQFEVKLDKDAKTLFMFMGVEPLKRDEKGRIVEMRLWMVQCGPPPPKEAETGAPPPPENETEEERAARIEREAQAMISSGVTKEPLEGLTIEAGMCKAVDPAAVRRAVAASKAWDTDGPTILYWVKK